MKWYLNRKVNYFPFDIYNVNRGYTVDQWRVAGVGFHNTFYYFQNGYIASYRGQSDIGVIVSYLSKKFSGKYVEAKGRLLKNLSVIFLGITKRTFSSRLNLEKYFDEFCRSQSKLFGLFQIPEYCQLFLPAGDKKLLVKFGLCREYAIKRIIIAEKIYRERLGRLIGVPAEPALMLLPNEVGSILRGNQAPEELAGRKTFCLYNRNGKEKIYWNRSADLTFKKIIKPVKKKADWLLGKVAWPGKCRGKAYVALNRRDFKNIPNAAILICSMTRYDIVNYLPRVKAIITDQGGITCHAAIIARELKVPTIVGTYHATDVFQTGDWVEVDAIKGIIRRLK